MQIGQDFKYDENIPDIKDLLVSFEGVNYQYNDLNISTKIVQCHVVWGCILFNEAETEIEREGPPSIILLYISNHYHETEFCILSHYIINIQGMNAVHWKKVGQGSV